MTTDSNLLAFACSYKAFNFRVFRGLYNRIVLKFALKHNPQNVSPNSLRPRTKRVLLFRLNQQGLKRDDLLGLSLSILFCGLR